MKRVVEVINLECKMKEHFYYMDKQAFLEDIYNSAFEDELEKSAFLAAAAKSFISLGRGLKAVPKMLGRIADPGKSKMWAAGAGGGAPVRESLTSGRAAGQLGKHLMGTARKSSYYLEISPHLQGFDNQQCSDNSLQ